MSGKKHLLSVFCLGIFLLLNISLVSSICYIETTAATCTANGDNVVMRLSALTNAHGELANQSNFAQVLCCEEGSGGTTCTANNKILGLASSTNSHAERPENTNYANNVCYDGLKNCGFVNTSLASDEISVIGLSASTNAHLGGVNDYKSITSNKTIVCAVDATAQPCELSNARWETTEKLAGNDVQMLVDGTGCDGEEISFEVKRGSASCSAISGCNVPSSTPTFGVGETSVSGTWTTGPESTTEYSFTASVVGDSSVTASTSQNLLVTGSPSWCEVPETQPSFCSDYESQSDCSAAPAGICEPEIDAAGLLQASVPSNIDCSQPGVNCHCVWDATESVCTGTYNQPPICGNNQVEIGESCDDGGTVSGDGCSATCAIEEPISCNNNNQIDSGEFCDGTSLGGETCQTLGYNGGSLSCNSCEFETSECINIGSYCGDGIINPGEQCDLTEFGEVTECSQFGLSEGTGLTCTNNCEIDTSSPYCTGTAGPCGNGIINPGETCDEDFSQSVNSCNDLDDFTGGDLGCSESCQLDTLECTGGPGDLPSGTCFYTADTTDTCEDDGYLTVTWNTRWEGTVGSPEWEKCVSAPPLGDNGLEDVVACPAQIPLPFFSIYNLIISMLLIAAIYLISYSRKKA